MSTVTYELFSLTKESPGRTLVKVTEGEKYYFLNLPTDEAHKLVRRMSMPTEKEGPHDQ